MDITRICGECKQLIYLEKDEFVLYKKTYYHDHCLVLNRTSLKKGKWTEERALELVKSLKPETRQEAVCIIERERLFKWLQMRYGFITMPSGIFTRLEAVFNGSFRGMSRGIPPGDLLDMWQRKWNELVKTYSYNKSVGKSMDETQRVYYDLAILLAKSTSYYAWKEQQARKQEELAIILETPIIDLSKINKVVTQNIQLQNENDLSSYLEEI